MDEKFTRVRRYAAFTNQPSGGNPAGVVLKAKGWTDGDMQRVAAHVGYSETVFVTDETEDNPVVRYYSPVAEVAFCGHATIALAVALAERDGPGELTLQTKSGQVVVRTRCDPTGLLEATLTSVRPRVCEAKPADLTEALETLGWAPEDLHPEFPPRVSYAGASHLILVAARLERLHRLDYDYERLKSLLDRVGWTTVHLVSPHESLQLHTARNAFPAGPVREDPATGAAAAAYGAYLRAIRTVNLPARIEVRQGEAMGRPSALFVDIPPGEAGISVSGNAVALSA